MLASASSSSKRCSWCGMFSSENETSCSKCGAVSSSFVLTSARPAVVLNAPAKESLASTAPGVSELDRSLHLDTVSDDAMMTLGLSPQFISGKTVAFAVAACLSVYALISLAGVAVDVSQLEIVPKRPMVVARPSDGLTAAEALTLLIRVFLMGVALFTGVFFLVWIYRAHKNLKALGATDLNYSPGWAIGGFFVPILNIVRPYQVITEIWKASAYKARRSRGASWLYEPLPIFITAWWGLWLFSGFLDFLSATMILGLGRGNEASAAGQYRILSYIANIACAALAAAVVLKINAKQEEANKANSEIERTLRWA